MPRNEGFYQGLAYTMNRPLSALFFAVIVLGGTCLYLWALERTVPILLERDREGSVWYLHDLADRKIREAADLRGIASREQRQRLLAEAADHLARIREMRPDSEFYEYYWAVTRYDSVMLIDPREVKAVSESVGKLAQLWEDGGRQSEKLGRILAYHYLHLDPDPPQAEVLIRRLLELNPDEGEYHDDLIDVFLQQGKVSDAIVQLEAKIAMGLDTADNRVTLSELYFKQYRWERVEDLLESNLSGGATTPKSWLLYSLVKSIQEDSSVAVQGLRRFLEGTESETPLPTTPLEGMLGYPESAFPAFSYFILESGVSENGAAP